MNNRLYYREIFTTSRSFIMKYLFWNRIQEITKVIFHESLELYCIGAVECIVCFRYFFTWLHSLSRLRVELEFNQLTSFIIRI